MEKAKPRAKPFAQEEDEYILQAAGDFTPTHIARALGRPRASIYSRMEYLGVPFKQGRALSAVVPPIPEVGETPEWSPPQIVIEPRVSKSLIDNLPHATLVYGDTHFPFHDPKAVEIVYRFCEMVEVDDVYHIGDLVDNWQISDYLPPDERKLTQEQKDYASQFKLSSEHLAQVAQLTPNAKRVLLGGNHEDRWDRLLRAAQTDSKWRHVLSLPQMQAVFSIDWILATGQAGFKYVPYGVEQVLNDRVVITHGDRTGIWVARTMLQRYGKSTIFGHAHIIQNYTQRDLRGTDSAWCIGCLCELDPHYTYSSHSNWAQGFALIIWDDQKDNFAVHQLRVHEGRCVTPWGAIIV